MIKTYRCRLYPTKSQRTVLGIWLDLCRWVYNKTLEIRKVSWETEKTRVRLYTTNKMLPGWKETKPELKQVHSQVLQNTQGRVDLAFQGFFRRLKTKEKPGYPRFKGKDRYDSLCFPQYPGGCRLENKTLVIRGIGTIRMNLHRLVEGKIKTTTIKKTSTGKWFVTFSVETKMVPLPPSSKAVGIDVGLESFFTTDQGKKVPNPRFFRQDEKELAKVQRRLAKEKKGTPERRRRRKSVALVHEKIRNKRQDFAHKVTRKIIERYGIICVEDLAPSNMIRNHCLAKSIADAAWTQLKRVLVYKAEEAGRRVVLVDPCYTSQDCSRCGHRLKKKLSDRAHNCPACGFVMDRDQNAALNILRLGLQSLASQPRSSCL